MNSSKPKLGNADEDYWKHTKLAIHWDAGCRIRHQQPSWYFSFLGRRQKLVEWVDRSHNYNNRGYGQGYTQRSAADGTDSVAVTNRVVGEQEVRTLQG